MGKRRNTVFSVGSFEKAIENHVKREANREQRTNDNVNNAMRRAVRKGETGPGAEGRKIKRIDWKSQE